MRKWLKDYGGVGAEFCIIISLTALGLIATSPAVRHGVNKAICNVLGGISGVQFGNTGQLSRFTANPAGSSYHMCQTVVKLANGTPQWGTVLNVNKFLW